MQNYKNPRLTCGRSEATSTAVVCLSGVEFAYRFSHTCRMVANHAQRLADAVRERREELDMSQLDLWQAGGPSNTTLTKIENGHLESLERVTARRLDKGLRWLEGSAKAVWVGGDPTPLESISEYAAEVEASNLSPNVKAHILRVLAEDRAGEQGGRGAS